MNIQTEKLYLIKNITTTLHPQSLSSLCEAWSTTKDNPIPGICAQYVNPESDHLHQENPNTDGLFSPLHIIPGIATGRNMSIAASLACVLLVLTIIACAVRQRKSKLVQAHSRDNTTRVYMMVPLNRQQKRDCKDYPVDVPPDYQTVMMVEDEEDGELPTYSEAVVGYSVRDDVKQEDIAM